MSDLSDLAVDPTNASATLNFSRDLMRQGDLDLAERLVRWSLDFNPESERLYRRMSEIELQRGHLAMALSWAERAATVKPLDAPTQSYLANIRLRLGDLPAAETAIGTALLHDPDNATYKRQLSDILARQGHHATAVDYAEQAIAASPDAANFYHLSGLYVNHGEFGIAEATVRRGLMVNAENPMLLRRMSTIKLRRGDRGEALAWANRGIAAAPDDWAQYANLGDVHAAYDALEPAMEAMRKAHQIAPDDRGLLRKISALAIRRGDLDAARGFAEQALAADDTDASAHNHIAWLHMFRNDLDAAEQALRAGLERAPGNAGLMRRLSEIAQKRGDMPETLRWARAAIEADPRDVLNHLHLSSLHFAQGNLPAAKTEAEHAVALAPRNASVLRRLAELTQRQGDLPQAFAWCDKAIEANPADPAGYSLRGILHLSLGEVEQAAAAMQRAVSLAPLQAAYERRLSYINALPAR